MISKAAARTAAWLWAAALALASTVPSAQSQSSQCPWGRDQRYLGLQASCICSLGQVDQALSVQCQFANFTQLMEALHGYAQNRVIELLYVNNSTVHQLTDFAFKNLKVISLQISNAGMMGVAHNAFRGMEDTLQNLNLGGNELRSVPVQPLRQLRLVSLLDLSANRIKHVPNNAFVTLRLKTLKLAENNLTMAENALRGQETSLKNLNLKGCQLKTVPEAVRSLRGLAFLDLAQNNIRTLEPGIFRDLDSLTALNLERNIIQKLHAPFFEGVADTLSSLSLLNNLLTEYPVEAIMSLKNLRVLDLGFNLLRVLPAQAFRGVDSLTLLALDGNPMSTVPEEAFARLNGTLRGLSLGGRFLACDCRMRWVARWIALYDLQVTSRERNPQFCGHPQHLRDKNFYQLRPEDLVCGDPKPKLRPPLTATPRPPPPSKTTSTTTTTTRRPPPRTTTPQPPPPQPTRVEVYTPQRVITTTNRPRRRGNQRPTVITGTSSGVRPGDIITEIKMTVGQKDDDRVGGGNGGSGTAGASSSGANILLPVPTTVTSRPPPARVPAGRPRGQPSLPPIVSRPREPPIRDRPRSVPEPKIINKANLGVESSPYAAAAAEKPPPPMRRADVSLRPRQDVNSLVDRRPSASTAGRAPEEVVVRDAYKEGTSIIINWESEVSNILGFRVVYRLFGQPEFKQGPPLAPSEREFRIKNVPANECIVVCVVSLEDLNITPGSVAHEQCREMRTEGVGGKKLDWIIIPASSAIVATVVIAVVIFIACLKTSQKTKEGRILEEKPIHTLSMSGMGTLPPGPPLAGLASLGLGPPAHKEWDQMSMYSQRTDRSGVNRARMYHMERSGSITGNYIPEDARSHLSAMSARTKSKSIGDLTGKNYLATGAGFGGGGLGLSRQDLRQSRQSLFHAGGGYPADRRQSRASRKSSSRHSVRSRSRSRHRIASNAAAAVYDDNDSLNEDEDSVGLGEDDDNWGTSADNWTDYDQDIYMHRNTRKFGHSTGGMFSRDDVNL